MTDLETYVNERFQERWQKVLPGLILVLCVRRDAPDLPKTIESRIDVPKKDRSSLAEGVAKVAVDHLLRQIGQLWLNAPAIIHPWEIAIVDEEDSITFTLEIEGLSPHPDRAK